MADDISKVLRKFEYGVYVVTMGKGNEGNAFTASWVSQVSSEPPMITLAVRENRRRFARALGVPLERLFEQRQVHGSDVREVAVGDDPEAIADVEGDALVTRADGIAVAARTADCVPILIAHPPTGHVAAVHAGWRGAVAGVESENRAHPATMRAMSL